MYRFHVLQADETPVKVSKDGRPANSKSYMWVYRTGKEYGDTPIILYEYQKTRKADHPREFLKGFTGVVICDGYSAYRKLDRDAGNRSRRLRRGLNSCGKVFCGCPESTAEKGV